MSNMLIELILLGFVGQLLSILTGVGVLKRGLPDKSNLDAFKMYFTINLWYILASVVIIIICSYLLSQADGEWLLKYVTTLDGSTTIQFKIVMILAGWLGASLVETIRKLVKPIKLISK